MLTGEGDLRTVIDAINESGIDLYIEKSWEKISVNLEAPLVSGDIGNVYDANTESSVSANAIRLSNS